MLTKSENVSADIMPIKADIVTGDCNYGIFYVGWGWQDSCSWHQFPGRL